MADSVARFPLFAVGHGYSAFDEFEALEKGRERDWALTLARLCRVMAYGPGEASQDIWSPPDLFMCKFGGITTIYAVKDHPAGAEVLALICADASKEKYAATLEATARRRLEDATGWR